MKDYSQMKNAKIYDPILDKESYFDYNKVIQADNKPIDIESIKRFKKGIKKFYE